MPACIVTGLAFLIGLITKMDLIVSPLKSSKIGCWRVKHLSILPGPGCRRDTQAITGLKDIPPTADRAQEKRGCDQDQQQGNARCLSLPVYQ